MRTRIIPALPCFLLLALLCAPHRSRAADNERDQLPDHHWQFREGREFPGASGDFSFEELDGKTVGLLRFDFTQGGKYVGVASAPTLASAHKIRFEFKSEEPLNVLVRIRDAGGEIFQFSLPYAKTGDWALMEFDLSAPVLHFAGGPNSEVNGHLDTPLREIFLGAERIGDQIPAGEAFLKNLRIE